MRIRPYASLLLAIPLLATSTAAVAVDPDQVTLSGTVSANRVRLPAHVEVTADTTIVADTVEFTARKVRIVSHGHAFRLHAKRTDRMAPSSTITIDTSGTSGGGSGIGGSIGSDGFDGSDGESGYVDPNSCAGDKNGKAGGAGQDGGAGGNGGSGTAGGDAGPIVLDIPEGSQDRYVLIARGGQGGSGGPGGPGGSAGSGGAGGGGGYGYMWCGDGIGGNGGQGGKGGNGGRGGTGGTGGAGGKGGNVNIAYPPGYDRSWVTKDLRGGAGGGGGGGGFSGIPGTGGSGGQAGNGDFGSGSPGSPGFGGISQPGSSGNSGSSGSDGQETTNPMTTVRLDKQVYLVGETPTYTVTGAPNSPILWSSTRNGASTGEVDAFYGQYTNGQGRWTGQGSAWQEDQLGNWTKTVKIAGETSSAAVFEVRASGPWAAWSPLGGGLTESIAATVYRAQSQELFAFARGYDNALYVNRKPGPFFTGWQGLGGQISSKPVAVTSANLLTPYVFARGADGGVIYRTFNGFGFDDWRSLGGYIVGAPSVAVVYPPPDQQGLPSPYLMVFARGGDNALYVNRQVDDQFTGWQGLGGYLTSDPAATGLGRGEGAQVFVRNGGGGVSTIRWTGSAWTGWQDLGGAIQGNPAAETTPTYNPDTRRFTFVLARGTDDSLLVNQFDSGWSGWQSLGGVLRSDPVTAHPDLTSHPVYVAVRGTDDGVHVNRWTRYEGWRGWTGIGGATTRAPGIASQYSGPAQVFGVGLSNNAGYYREFL